MDADPLLFSLPLAGISAVGLQKGRRKEEAAATLLLHRPGQGRKSVLGHGGRRNKGAAVYLPSAEVNAFQDRAVREIAFSLPSFLSLLCHLAALFHCT